MAEATTSETRERPVFREDLLAGKTVLVTGGGSGLGLSMSKRFAEVGANVAITGRSAERREKAAGEISTDAARVATVACDVRDLAAVDAKMAEVTAHFGRVDVLVNNAAGNFL